MNEKRRFHRVRFDCVAKLNMAGKQYVVEVLDLSLKGVLVRLPARLELAEQVPAVLAIGLGQGQDIVMELEPAHREGDQAGFHCAHIDVDSMTHLRRLVELNAGDSSLAERELAALSAGG